METISTELLDKLILKGREAERFAWEHYEELCAREKSYTLYGPDAYGIGAEMPGSIVPKSSRKLTKQTRRKNYIIYELDNNFHLLRTIRVRNYHEISDSYQCFEMDGIHFSCHFKGNQKLIAGREVFAIFYKNKQPQWFAYLTTNSVNLEMYSYTSPSKAKISLYLYSRVSKYNWNGYPVDFSAPFGSPYSPISYGSCEAEPMDTDFSVYFENDP